MNSRRQTAGESKAAETRAQVKAALDKCTAGVEACRTSEGFQQYLKAQSHFHNYSYSNTLLIMSQNPSATYVAGFNTWKGLGDKDNPVYVRKGEKGIMVLAPAPYKAQEEKRGEDGKVLLNEDGTPEMETVIKPAFRRAYVYDVSQVEGVDESMFNPCVDLTDDVPNFEELKTAIMQVSDAPITFGPVDGGAHGYYRPGDHTIVIKEGMPEAQTIKTMLHEVAHSRLHSLTTPEQEALFKRIGDDDLDELAFVAGYPSYRDMYEAGTRLSGFEDVTPDIWERYQSYGITRAVKETQAEAVAFVTTSHLGIRSDDYSFPYLATWGSRDQLELRESLHVIQRTSCDLINQIDRQMEVNRLANTDALAYRINGYGYLMMQRSSDGGYDYTFYSRRLRPMDGGHFDDDSTPMDTAAKDTIVDQGFEIYRVREIDVLRLMDQLETRDDAVKQLATQIADQVGLVRDDMEPEARAAIIERVTADLDTNHPCSIDMLKDLAETNEAARHLLEDASKLVDIDSAVAEVSSGVHIAS